MIDQRLWSRNDYLVDMDRRILAASEEAKQPWVNSAREALAGFFADFLRFVANKEELTITNSMEAFCGQISPRSLVTSIDNECPPAFLEDIHQALLNDQHHVFGLANWVIGLSLVDALISRAEPSQDIRSIAPLIGANDVRIYSFAHAVCALTQPKLAVILSAFEELVERERLSPERHVLSRHQEGLLEALVSWNAETDIGKVWDTRCWVGFDMYSEELTVLGVLCASMPDHFLALCERLQVPPLMEGVLRSPSIETDPDCLLLLLGKAPPVLDPNTGSWNRNIVAPMLLEIAFDYVYALSRPSVHGGETFAEDEELSTFVQNIVLQVIERMDGVFLMSRWMCHMIWQAGSRGDEKQFQIVFNSAIATLARLNFPITGLFETPSELTRPADSAFTPQLPECEARCAFEQLMLAAMIEQERVELALAPIGSSLRPAFKHLLRQARDVFGPAYREQPPSWRHYTIAKLYVHEADFCQAWTEDFASFSQERRASLHWSYTDDRTLAAPSIFLASVGLAIIDLCCAAGEGSLLRQQAVHMWDTAFDASRLYATHWSQSDDQWHQVASALFARYPNCVRASGLENVHEHSKTWLNLIGGDEKLFATALAVLGLNGMDLLDMAHNEDEAAVWKERIYRYLDWDESVGSRRLTPQVLAYWLRRRPKSKQYTPV